MPHLRLADVHWKAGNREAAMQSLKRALGIAPDNLQAQRALIDAYLSDKDVAQAIGVARQIAQPRARPCGALTQQGKQGLRQRDRAGKGLFQKGVRPGGKCGIPPLDQAADPDQRLGALGHRGNLGDQILARSVGQAAAQSRPKTGKSDPQKGFKHQIFPPQSHDNFGLLARWACQRRLGLGARHRRSQ